ncbi:MAG: TRAP transporter small permease [Pseudomonadota bacterium]
MTVIVAVLKALIALNSTLLAAGRVVAWMALALMVVVILTQVWFRYVMGSALNWPDEAARFLMLWMTGLIAPSAYRWGGFVAIDMVPAALGRAAGRSLNLLFLALSFAVLLTAVWFGWKHVNGGWLFGSSTLKLPMHWFGGRPEALKLAWMYMSLWVGLVLLTLVNVELMLREWVGLAAPDLEPPRDAEALQVQAD